MRLGHIEPTSARFSVSESTADRITARRWVRFCSSPVFGSGRRRKTDFLFTVHSHMRSSSIRWRGGVSRLVSREWPCTLERNKAWASAPTGSSRRFSPSLGLYSCPAICEPVSATCQVRSPARPGPAPQSRDACAPVDRPGRAGPSLSRQEQEAGSSFTLHHAPPPHTPP